MNHLDIIIFFQGLKYRIKQVSPHSLHFDSSCNRDFGEDIKNYLDEDVRNLFQKSIFEKFRDMPNCNFQGQILKCLLMFEIEQDNSDEIHVYVKGTILKFSIFEFAFITGLKCTDNIEDYLYTESSKSILVDKYFFNAKNSVKMDIFPAL